MKKSLLCISLTTILLLFGSVSFASASDQTTSVHDICLIFQGNDNCSICSEQKQADTKYVDHICITYQDEVVCDVCGQLVVAQNTNRGDIFGSPIITPYYVGVTAIGIEPNPGVPEIFLNAKVTIRNKGITPMFGLDSRIDGENYRNGYEMQFTEYYNENVLATFSEVTYTTGNFTYSRSIDAVTVYLWLYPQFFEQAYIKTLYL